MHSWYNRFYKKSVCPLVIPVSTSLFEWQPVYWLPHLNTHILLTMYLLCTREQWLLQWSFHTGTTDRSCKQSSFWEWHIVYWCSHLNTHILLTTHLFLDGPPSFTALASFPGLLGWRRGGLGGRDSRKVLCGSTPHMCTYTHYTATTRLLTGINSPFAAHSQTLVFWDEESLLNLIICSTVCGREVRYFASKQTANKHTHTHMHTQNYTQSLLCGHGVTNNFELQ